MRKSSKSARRLVGAGLLAALASAGPVFAQELPTNPQPDGISLRGASRGPLFQAAMIQPPAPPVVPPAAGGDSDIPTLEKTVVEAEAPPVAPPTQPPAPAPAPTPAAPAASYYNTPFSSGPVRGYDAQTSTSGTFFNAPLIDVPTSIQVLTPDLLADQAIFDLNNIVRDVPGMSNQTNAGGRQEEFNIRGLDAEFRKNGFRDQSRVLRELANVDRIEVVRGPASVLYGSGQPSGTINVITKKPLAEAASFATYQGGSFDTYRLTADSTGPLFGSENILYRITAAGQDSGSFRDFVFTDRGFVSPVVTFNIDSDTSLTFEGEYMYDARLMDRGVPALRVNGVGTPVVGLVPISRFLQDPLDKSQNWDGQIAAFLNHQIDDDWAWQAKWCSNISHEFRDNLDSRAVVFTGGQYFMNRARQVQDISDVQDHYFIYNLTGAWDANDWISHQAVVGTELGYSDFGNRSANANPVAGNGFNQIDIFDPTYYVPRPALGPYATSYTKNELYGAYWQDLISVGEKWKFMLGGRYDDSQRYNRTAAPNLRYQSSTAYTQRYGAVYQFVPETFAWYGNYAESFNPLNGGTLNNTAGSVPFEPERGKVWETGFKWNVSDYFSAIISGYDQRRFNSLVPDPTIGQPGGAPTGSQVQVGEVTSKGFDALVNAQLTDVWTITANCAYIDARITEDTRPAFVDTRLISVPFWSNSIWTRYNIVQNDERTVGLALGYMRVANREAVSAAPFFDLPDYERWDMAVYYSQGRVSAQVNIQNLLDVEYYIGSQSVNNIAPGAPVNALATVRIQY